MACIIHAALLAVVLMALGAEGQDDPVWGGDEIPHWNPDLRPVPGPCVYEWTPFLPWTPCSVSCGKGYQTRTRYCTPRWFPCTDPKLAGVIVSVFVAGKPITSVPSEFCSPGANIETRECYGAVNGNWSEWGCWGECINGTRQRHRICNNPIPTGWGNYCVGKHTEREECCDAGQDIVFVIDRSGSIPINSYNSMVNQVNSVIKLLDLDTGSGPLTSVRVGIELFNHNQFDLKHLNNFVLPATPYPYNGGGTNIAAAISFAHNTMFTVRNGDRIRAPNTMVLITDGRSFPIPAVAAATAAKNAGIKIIAIGVGSGVDVALLEDIVSDPSTDLHTTPNFCSIASDLKKIFNCPKNQAESERTLMECTAARASADSEAQFAPQEEEDFLVDSSR